MYRRHIKMTQTASADRRSKSQLLQHLANIPAVCICWSIAVQTYKVLKTSNKYLNSSLTSVEKAAGFVSRKAEPFVKKLEPQINTVDKLACKGLENLEEIVPTLLRKPEQIFRYTKSKYNEMVESGLQKYEEVKQTTISTAKEVQDLGVQQSTDFLNSPSGQLIVMALNTSFDAYEMYLDRLLPPLGDEAPEQAFGDRSRPPVFDRADILTERFKERLYKYSLLRLQNARIRGKLTLAKLYNVNFCKAHVMHTKQF